MTILILVWLALVTGVVIYNTLKLAMLEIKPERKKGANPEELTTEEIDSYVDFARMEQAIYERGRLNRRGWHGFTPEQRRIAIAQRATREAHSRGRRLDHDKAIGRVGHG